MCRGNIRRGRCHGFFQIGCTIGVADTLRIACSYNLKNLRPKTLANQIKKVWNREQESYLLDKWWALYPYMSLRQLEFISFDDFKERFASQKKVTTLKSSEEIEEEIKSVFGLE